LNERQWWTTAHLSTNAVDDNENDGGGAEEKTIVEREGAKGENGEGGKAVDEEEVKEIPVMASGDGRGNSVVVAVTLVSDVKEVEKEVEVIKIKVGG